MTFVAESLTDGTDTAHIADLVVNQATWSNLDGSGTIAGRDDYNVASYTDQGTGQYRHSFTTNMTNTTDQFIAGNGSTNTDLADRNSIHSYDGGDILTSSHDGEQHSAGAGNLDADTYCLLLIGNYV